MASDSRVSTEAHNAAEVARALYTAALKDELTASAAFGKAVEVIQELLDLSVKEAATFVEEEVLK
jgi:hypothetical protein